MKRSSATSRLQMIKEVAKRNTSPTNADPMAQYINTLIHNKTSQPKQETKRIFSGLHFDEHAGGWVSDNWDNK
ncbi:hypothetical protein P0F40_001478 [Vibrio metschnikovii]|uniref:Uncharacterized protein n=2 Tax=Unclassified Bacteria TaxID=49928 RepID=A0AAU6URA8_UNCXX|nr:hypothetical protein [Vibrio metschnikovii]EKO3723111.1 hypothetical protein [Vibrio metschnikovii]EKO3877518.1 hypothetical protein [Vibrio metschnikovii]EKO3879754.1 hypothetical protein [Vibrio metschnikovii]EKO3912694.1 hypothetical protein [Vibrio metschnikovii]